MLSLKATVPTTLVLTCTASSLLDGARVARMNLSGQCIRHIPSLRSEKNGSAANMVGHVLSARSKRTSFSFSQVSDTRRSRSIQAGIDTGEPSTEASALTEVDKAAENSIASATAAVIAQDPVSAAEAAASIQQMPSSETGEAGPSAIGPVLTAIYAQCQTWQWKGMAINYVKQGSGSGPAVLLVHGFGASIGHFRK